MEIEYPILIQVKIKLCNYRKNNPTVLNQIALKLKKIFRNDSIDHSRCFGESANKRAVRNIIHKVELVSFLTLL